MPILFLLFFILTGTALQAKESTASVLFRDNHPTQWVVQPDDTKWDVARIFLANPWRWDTIWGKNKAPENLYPGDIIKVHQEDGITTLRYLPQQKSNAQIVRLGPQIIATPYNPNTTNTTQHTIAYDSIDIYLRKGMIFSNTEKLDRYPKIILSHGDREYNPTGWSVFTHQHPLLKAHKQFDIYRQYKALKKDDEIIGIGTKLVGAVSVIAESSDIYKLRIDEARTEILSGDILVPKIKQTSNHDFTLKKHNQDSTVIAQFSSYSMAGQYASIIIEGGHDEKMQRGSVFSIYASPKSMLHYETQEKMTFTDKKPIGKAMVYKVFDNLSYALILSAKEPVKKNMILKAPSTLEQ